VRTFDGGKLVIASHNAGKVREIDALLRPFGADVISAGDLDLPEPDEDADTFEGNAELKALAAAKASNLPALADDSGLEVASLNGAPGIYSARWAGPEKDFGHAMQLVWESVKDFEDRNANFTCALSLAWPDGHVQTYLGKVFGIVSFPPRGDMGFGYDPIFVPEGYQTTFAEMDPSAKHAISHRAEAFKLLVNACFR